MRFIDVITLVNENGAYVIVEDKKKLISELNLSEKEKYRNYTVTSIGSENGCVVLKLCKSLPPKADVNTDWAKEYKQQNRTEPSFF